MCSSVLRITGATPETTNAGIATKKIRSAALLATAASSSVPSCQMQQQNNQNVQTTIGATDRPAFVECRSEKCAAATRNTK